MQVSVPKVQFQPEPLMAVALRPAGSRSVAVTVPTGWSRAVIGDGEGVGDARLPLREISIVKFEDGEIGPRVDGHGVAGGVVGGVQFPTPGNSCGVGKRRWRHAGYGHG